MRRRRRRRDAVWVMEEKIRGYGWRSKWGREWEGDGPRERISGKIIAKFEYDSPRGYDPVEDIREILQASFVRGLLSLSAVFFSPYPLPRGFFLPRTLPVLSRAVLSAFPSTLRRFDSFPRGQTNLPASCGYIAPLSEEILFV